MLPIILIIFIVSTLIATVIMSVKCVKADDAGFVIIVFIVGMLIIATPCIILSTSISNHAINLSNVRNGAAFIEIKEMAIEDIDQQITDLSKFKYDTALLNADSPISSLVKAKSEFVRALSYERDLVLRQKAKIDAREIGLMGAIVDWYGKE